MNEQGLKMFINLSVYFILHTCEKSNLWKESWQLVVTQVELT